MIGRRHPVRWLLLYSFFCGVLAGCQKSGPAEPDDTPTPDDPVQRRISIVWDHESEKKISHNAYNAEYPRVRRIKGDTLFLVYRSGPQGHTWDNVALRKSFDNGETWEPVQIIAQDTDPNYHGFSDPELLVLQNGWMIIAYEGRGNPDTNNNTNIQVRISKDWGETWSAPIIAYRGRSWEPAMIQLPDGEVQLFLASEARWWPSPEPRPQEILMIRSFDNGESWSEPVQVAYTENLRDGMPVPLLLQDNKGIVLAIENVGLPRSPWIIYSSLSQNWNYPDLGTVGNGRRWRAVQEDIHGGGPYIIQLSSGETVLACHMPGGRNIPGWRKNTMAVYIGDSDAKNFADRSYPWPNLPITDGAIFNSLFEKNDSTIVALTSRIYQDGHGEVYWKEGRIVR